MRWLFAHPWIAVGGALVALVVLAAAYVVLVIIGLFDAESHSP